MIFSYRDDFMDSSENINLIKFISPDVFIENLGSNI